MRNQKQKIKDIILSSLFTAGAGFLIGDLIIGGIIWCIQSLKTGHWGSTILLRIHYGIIFGLVGLVIGPFLIPILNFIESFFEKKRISRQEKDTLSNKCVQGTRKD